MRLPTSPRDLTLRAACAIEGYETTTDLAHAIGIPSRVISSMMLGQPAYPKARAAVAQALGVTDDDLAAMLNNSRRRAESGR